MCTEDRCCESRSSLLNNDIDRIVNFFKYSAANFDSLYNFKTVE